MSFLSKTSKIYGLTFIIFQNYFLILEIENDKKRIENKKRQENLKQLKTTLLKTKYLKSI
jgi:hypothetical protein